MVEKLNQAEMCSLKGGVTKEEYCKTLATIRFNNDLDDGAAAAAKDAWNTHCA